MSQSKYDTDQDGICDAPECKGILHTNRKDHPQGDMTPIIEQSFDKIGLELETREQLDAYPAVSTVSQEHADLHLPRLG